MNIQKLEQKLDYLQNKDRGSRKENIIMGGAILFLISTWAILLWVLKK